MTATDDFLVIGAGIIGLAVARELRAAFPDARVAVIEKERALGAHASGRNSGVLHAGFYYTADSLKARFTRDGNALLQEFCAERGLALHRCGKLVVARSEAELAQLGLLFSRAKANGVEVAAVDAAQAREIEPRVKLFGDRALWSPTTATVDPLEILSAMERELAASRVTIEYGTRFVRAQGGRVITDRGAREAGYVINCAGLYADAVAQCYGFARDYRILPFKGLYVYSAEPRHSLRTNVYPVPDLRNPFLGVHFTVTVHGDVKIGPTALPALWREQYDLWRRFRAGELIEIGGLMGSLLLRAGFEFRALARQELAKISARRLAALAGELVTGVDPAHYTRWAKPGIRAQLLDVRTRKLEMDFVVEGDARSYHVLNAVSPAFTCSIPMARHIVADVSERAGR